MRSTKIPHSMKLLWRVQLIFSINSIFWKKIIRQKLVFLKKNKKFRLQNWKSWKICIGQSWFHVNTTKWCRTTMKMPSTWPRSWTSKMTPRLWMYANVWRNKTKWNRCKWQLLSILKHFLKQLSMWLFYCFVKFNQTRTYIRSFFIIFLLISKPFLQVGCMEWFMWKSGGYPIKNHAKGSEDANASWTNWKRNRSGQLDFDQTEGKLEMFFFSIFSCKN